MELLGLLSQFVDARKRATMNNLRNPGLLGQRTLEDLANWSKQMSANAQASGSVMPSMQAEGRDAMVNSATNMSGLLGIVKPSVANSLNVPASLPADELFASAVRGTPGASITPEGLLMRIQRNQMPEQGQQESVRGGVFYLPEGAAQAKHYSSRKPGGNYYGGEERIKGETLIKNPLFAKGGTGGKAPEAAYDSLMGKGAYQEMRKDAQHWGGGPREIREEAVYKFLEKYAPEMEHLAGYIVQNSKQGNQLAYALQEAAVGSAVRRAGHDAVVGHSKGKSGPFLSEVFDVRESHYPDKFGFSRVWDDFEK